MICYCVRNKIDNKKYIGITKELKKKFNSHKSDINRGIRNIFYNAVRKYGFANFEFSFINDYSDLVTYEELKEIETDMIAKYNTYYKFGIGYNMTLGGEGGDRSKTIIQYDINTLKKINIFNSIKEASLLTGGSISGISKNCRKEVKSSGGFIWCFENDILNKYKNESLKKVCQYEKENN